MKKRVQKPEGERDRERTEQRILAAVGRLLSRSGFDEVGVNAVAREAGVDKVLIYRYFDDLDGLLRAFAERGAHWPTDDELIGEGAPANPAELAAHVLVRFGRAIRARPETRAILTRELTEHNPLTDALAEARERQAERLAEHIGALGVDVAAIGALLGAGLTYLSLRAATAQTYNGIDLRSDEGWARLEKAVELVVAAVTRPPEPRRRGRGSG